METWLAWYPPFVPRASIRSWRSGMSSDYQTCLTRRLGGREIARGM